VLLLASGASGVTPSAPELADAVTEACAALARQLIADAEGAAHDIEIEVRSAATVPDALEVARAIARNNLFKCAVFGNDPNWGRVLAAVGTTRAAFEPAALDVAINGVQVCRAGGVGEDRSLVDLRGRDVHVVVDLHAGEQTATVWTNDLTHDYVHENSAYST
jgi:glutamate N-acetyltransferase/amino-acid N-acetyltransferase